VLKKRIIFTLLFDNGYFVLSRNFRLQKVGNLEWLQRNYNFSDVAFHIDERVVLDVSRGQRNPDAFCAVLEKISEGCFAPISAGGGIISFDYARQLLRSGADKIVVNSALIEQPALIRAVAENFGRQCIIGSIDLSANGPDGYSVFIKNGQTKVDMSVDDALSFCLDDNIGELYLNSIDRDGTGQGYDFGMLDFLPRDLSLPIILAGGVGKPEHFFKGLANDRVDAVATAHLFNFIGNGLKIARRALSEEGINLAEWPDKTCKHQVREVRTDI
jgi:cyclase